MNGEMDSTSDEKPRVLMETALFRPVFGILFAVHGARETVYFNACHAAVIASSGRANRKVRGTRHISPQVTMRENSHVSRKPH